MAIAFDSATRATTGTGTSLTFSHTVSGSNRILVVGVADNDATTGDTITGVTYNGVAMSRISGGYGTNTDGGTVFLYYLVAPATGTHNVVVSCSSSHSLSALAASYTGAAQTGQPDANTAQSTSASTSINISLTSVADKCWAVIYTKGGDYISASTGTTSRADTAEARKLGDLNGPITPAGSTSLHWTQNSSQKSASCMLTIAPAPTTDWTQTLTETLTTSDSLLKSAARSLSETITTSASIITGVVRSLSETATTVDTLTHGRGKTLPDATTLTDSITRKTVRALSEALTLTASAIAHPVRTLSESTTLADALAALNGHAATLSETITSTASLIRTTARTLAQSFTLSDTFAGFRATVSTLMETVAATDTLVRKTARTLTETLATAAALTRTTVHQLSEALGLSDSLQSGLRYGRVLTETISSADTLVRAIVHVLTERLTLTDILRRLRNGLSALWTNTTRAASTFANRTRSAANWTDKTRSADSWDNQRRGD